MSSQLSTRGLVALLSSYGAGKTLARPRYKNWSTRAGGGRRAVVFLRSTCLGGVAKTFQYAVAGRDVAGCLRPFQRRAWGARNA